MQNYVQAPELTANLAADGTAAGVVTVADSSVFWPGAHGVLSATDVDPIEVLILQDLGSGKLRVRNVEQTKHYGGTDVSAYTVAKGAKLKQYEQLVFPNPGLGVVSRIYSALK